MNTNTIFLIKDVARMSGQSIYTIKYYLKIGLIKEAGRSPETNFRFFDYSTLDRLAQIRSFRKQRKSLKEIQILLN
ncbi:MAG: MerR family transcriptional regulator [Candidatus Omnitrophica bacterium]|nr:MerR family transcriptional regulator [Candidatus Omnitrophota bacterium]